MALWGNNDAANSKPLLPVEREVVPTTTLITQNATIATANTITFQKISGANSIPSDIIVGTFVYSLDANTAVSRFPNGTIITQNEVSFFKSNNRVVAVDSANSTIRLANTLVAVLANNSTVFFANLITYKANTQANTYYLDTILMTPGRVANNRTTSASPAVANIGNMNQGWVHVQKKTNNDGAVRYMTETLVALANTSAANTASGNTSFGRFVSGL
jgi:hypothetical protein